MNGSGLAPFGVYVSELACVWPAAHVMGFAQLTVLTDDWLQVGNCVFGLASPIARHSARSLAAAAAPSPIY